MKKLLVMILAAVLILALMPVPALADTVGDLTVTGGVLDTDYSYESAGHRIVILTDTPLTISGTTTRDRVLVATDVTANLTISDLTISGNNAALEASEGATLNLTVSGTNTLSGSDYKAGVLVQNSAVLVITASSMGTLNAYGSFGAAGIGGNADRYMNHAYTGGTITINGGTINATGGGETYNAGAGIGSGWCCRPSSAAHITINGGVVTAVCNGYASAIGGGYNCSGSYFLITGGTVSAIGGHKGIGGGTCCGSGNMIVTGGSIYANGVGPTFYDEALTKTSYPTVVTLENVTERTRVTSLKIRSGGADYGYGVDDMYTDADGKLYLYLPLDAQTVMAEASGVIYGGAVTTTADEATSLGVLRPAGVITASAGAGGTISPCGESYIAFGESLTCNIAPDSGYHIASVSVDGAAVGAVSEHTFSAVSEDHTISAEFELDPIVSSEGATIYVGGSTTLTPPVLGGEWDWDEEYLSATFNSPATFTGLKAGTTTVTYTVDGVSASYDVTIEEMPAALTLSSSVASGKIYTGGRITLTPNIDGGRWDWDEEYLSATFNSPATFKGLKAGTSAVTYTVGGVSIAYEVTVEQSTLPSTGQDFSWAWMLAIGAAAMLIAGAAYGIRKRRKTAKY